MEKNHSIGGIAVEQRRKSHGDLTAILPPNPESSPDSTNSSTVELDRKFSDCLDGKIDLLTYVEDGPLGEQGYPLSDDEIRAMLNGPQPHHHLHQNGAVGDPSMYARLHHHLSAAAAATHHPQHHHHTIQNSYEHAVPTVRLPDSPPETDSGAGSAGSPSGSEAAPYSPDYQAFLQHHHNGLGPQPSQGVIHPPVQGTAQVPSDSDFPGVILSANSLSNDPVTTAVLEHIGFQLPSSAHQQQMRGAVNGANNHSPTYFPPAPTPGSQASPNGYSPYGLPADPFGSDTSLARKRIRTENGQYMVKPEPTSVSPQTSDDSPFYDELLGHQSIRFNEFQKEAWHTLCDMHGRELPPLGIKVVADKGFNYSQTDGTFINQKKNHFQVTVHIEVRDSAAPRFVRVAGDAGGLKPVSDFQLNFYGVKSEMVGTHIQIKQSQTDRKPIGYRPVVLELPPNKVTKVTVARLHFSETTMNNQRKNGRPNPDQKYFLLAVSLDALVHGEKYTVMSFASERVIVRASNPGQFDNGEGEAHWQRGQGNSIYHPGPVGIGTDRPDASLAVHGNLKVTGAVINPSDARLKENIEEVNCAEALSRMSQIRIVRYDFRPDVAERFQLSEKDRHKVGVIAQEVEELLPDAVRTDGDYLQVDENRIFFESAAAVKELCRLTGNLEYKIDEVEKIASKCKRLAKLRRFDSLRSAAGDDSCSQLSSKGYISCSQSSIATSTSPPTKRRKDESGRHHYCRRSDLPCNNKWIQSTVILLVAVMAFCLIAMATLYVLDWHKRHTEDRAFMAGVTGYGNSMGVNPNGTHGNQGGPGPDNIIDRVSPVTTPLPVNPLDPEYLRQRFPQRPPMLNTCAGPKEKCIEFCCPEEPPVFIKQHGQAASPTQAGGGTGAPAHSLRYIMMPPLGAARQRRALLNNRVDAVLDLDGRRVNQPLRIHFPSLNLTLDDRYCSGCTGPDFGRYEYFVPVSKYVPQVSLDVQFIMNNMQVAELCAADPGDKRCDDVTNPNGDDQLQSDSEQGSDGKSETLKKQKKRDLPVEQRHDLNTWQLPIGIYQSSRYTFRLAYSSPCEMVGSAIGQEFHEISITFYRVCNETAFGTAG